MKSVAILRRFAALSTVIALAACGGGGGGSKSLPAAPVTGGGSSNVQPTSKTVSLLHASKALAAAVTQTGPATSVNSLVLHIIPNLQNPAGLVQYAQQSSDPTSGNYRHFLTPADIASRFGATASDYAVVANYFASYGLKVGGWPQRLSLTVSGPRTNFEKALGTSFAFFSAKNGDKILAPSGTVQFSKALPIASISDAFMDPKARYRNSIAAGPNQGTLSGLTPQQVATAFDFNGAYAAGFTGAGITVGILGTGPAMTADFTAYKAAYGLGGSSSLVFPPVTAAAAANTGGSPTATPPPVTPPCTGASNPGFTGGGESESPTAICNPEDFEAQIDTEQAALAKDATIAFYLAYVPDECNDPSGTPCAPGSGSSGQLGYNYQGLAEVDDEIQQVIADNTADVVSGSYGQPEIETLGGYVADDNGNYLPNGFGVVEFAALASEGMATFISSGDQGAQTCAPAFGGTIGNDPCVSYPATDVSVTAVGGVTIPLNNAGGLLGPITGWGQQTFANGNGGASGGGVSCIVPLPAWETQASFETGSLPTAGSNAGCMNFDLPSAGGRVVPDVSLLADPITGVAVVANVQFGGEREVFGGTSVAAPQMAAMWALVLQACKQTTTCATATGGKPYRMGNPAPLFWNVYHTPATYNSTLFDVTFGNNGITTCLVQPSCPNPQPSPATGFLAGAGWDPVTGLGVPFARHLITAVVGI